MFIFTESDPTTAKNVLCLHKTEWGFVSNFGLAWGISMQLLVLLQINVSQHVLVRIPFNMGLFQKDAGHALKVGIRRKLSMKIANEFNEYSHL